MTYNAHEHLTKFGKKYRSKLVKLETGQRLWTHWPHIAGVNTTHNRVQIILQTSYSSSWESNRKMKQKTIKS